MRHKHSCPRGPAEHARRDAIVAAAYTYFRRYGYGKTTINDLAKAIGFSKSYVYKFFESKRAIGEAICGLRLNAVTLDLQRIANAEMPSLERLRALFQTLSAHAHDISVRETKLRDMVMTARQERWQPRGTGAEKPVAVVIKVTD